MLLNLRRSDSLFCLFATLTRTKKRITPPSLAILLAGRAARHKDNLINLLKSVIELPQEEYELIFLDTHLRPEFKNDKLGIVDVKVQTKSGKIINIEIHVTPFSKQREVRDAGKTKPRDTASGEYTLYPERRRENTPLGALRPSVCGVLGSPLISLLPRKIYKPALPWDCSSICLKKHPLCAIVEQRRRILP